MFTLPEKLIALAVAVAALLGGWEWEKHSLIAQGVAQCQAATAVAVAKQQAAASAVESQWEHKIDDIRHAHDLEVGSITAARDAALLSLHNRAPRRAVMSSAAASACNGASPALIDAPDASVAVGFATEFDLLRAEYQSCTEWVKAVTSK